MINMLKYFGIGTAVALGIVCGIIIGYFVLGDQHAYVIASKFPGDLGTPEELKLRFGPGDLLPQVKLNTVEGIRISLHQHIGGKKTAIIIVAPGCLPCEEFLIQWNQMVTPKLKNNAQEIVLISYDESTSEKNFSNYLTGKIVYQIDRNELEEKYNSVNFPTAIAIDENATIVSVQYGQKQGIDYDILKFLTTHDI